MISFVLTEKTVIVHETSIKEITIDGKKIIEAIV